MKEKMAYVIEAVLGGHWTIHRISYNEFWLNGDDGTRMEIISVHDLDSHWREQVSKAIHLIINERITKALNEV
jgi:hypothetical protein